MSLRRLCQIAGGFFLKGQIMKIMIEENCIGDVLAKLLNVLIENFGNINVATYEDYQELRYITIETEEKQ